jgi:hypothetical protein
MTQYTDLGPLMKDLISGMIAANFTPEEAIHQFDQAYLSMILEQENGNVCRAARRAGIHRNSFSRRLDPRLMAKVRENCRLYRKNRMTQLMLRGLKVPRVRPEQESRVAA